MTEQLKPCPFCGAEAKIKKNKTTMVSCTQCSASIFQQLDDAESAILGWNKREAAAGAPDLRSAIPTWRERAYDDSADPECKITTLMQEEIADLRAALASAAPAGHAEPVAWANVRESDGVVVGLSQHPEDIARWINPRALVFAAPVAAESGSSMEQINDAFFAWLNKQEEKDGSWELSPRETKQLHTVWMAGSEFILNAK